MAKHSAGILLYRLEDDRSVSVLLVHPGGPFWAKKDLGAWSIPKGEYQADEDPWQAAQREFQEELGLPLPGGTSLELSSITQKSGKTVTAWAIEGNLDVSHITSSMIEIDWPPRSGKKQMIPEVDKAQWMSVAVARSKINTAQTVFLDRLLAQLDGKVSEGTHPPQPQTLF